LPPRVLHREYSTASTRGGRGGRGGASSLALFAMTNIRITLIEYKVEGVNTR
jgi:hypothetical protein